MAAEEHVTFLLLHGALQHIHQRRPCSNSEAELTGLTWGKITMLWASPSSNRGRGLQSRSADGGSGEASMPARGDCRGDPSCSSPQYMPQEFAKLAKDDD